MPEHEPILIAPEPVPGLPLSDATIEVAPPMPSPVAQRPKYVEPRPGQKARILVPERKTDSGKPIPVRRPNSPSVPYQTGDVVRWDNHLVTLRQEGAVLATEIME